MVVGEPSVQGGSFQHESPRDALARLHLASRSISVPAATVAVRGQERHAARPTRAQSTTRTERGTGGRSQAGKVNRRRACRGACPFTRCPQRNESLELNKGS